MSVTIIPIDRTKTDGMLLSNLLNAWERVLEQHAFVRSKMIACGYSDSSAPDGSVFGLGTIQQANAAFVQIDTVTTNIASALASINQMIAQIG